MNESELFVSPELYAGPEGDKRLREDSDELLRTLSNIGTFLKGVPIYILGGILTYTTVMPVEYGVTLNNLNRTFATYSTAPERAFQQSFRAVDLSFMPRETNPPTEGDLVLRFLDTSPATLPKETKVTDSKTGKPIDN